MWYTFKNAINTTYVILLIPMDALFCLLDHAMVTCSKLHLSRHPLQTHDGGLQPVFLYSQIAPRNATLEVVNTVLPEDLQSMGGSSYIHHALQLRG